MNTWSPLRYPGGKGQMYPFVDRLLRENDLYGCHYIEPYAGGAGLAIRFLIEKKVRKITINDIDRSIYAVWHCILFETEKFIKKINDTDVNITEWRTQKEIQKNKLDIDLFTLGFSTFFLNRTNRSGIINAGPIGGQNQKGNYKINCRYNKKNLIDLIIKISQHKKNIFLHNSDGESLIDSIDKSSSFFFIDPPYYMKGKDLYVNYFDHKKHFELSKKIQASLLNTPFILTYDVCPEILDMYSYIPYQYNQLNYSLQDKKKSNELVFVNII